MDEYHQRRLEEKFQKQGHEQTRRFGESFVPYGFYLETEVTQFDKAITEAHGCLLDALRAAGQDERFNDSDRDQIRFAIEQVFAGPLQEWHLALINNKETKKGTE